MKITESDLAAMVRSQARRAMNSDGSELSRIRQHSLDMYHGRPLPGDDTEEMDGRSKYITREVQEGIEWAMPSILTAFFSTPKPVEFMAVGPEDERAAEQESIVVNHVIMENSFLEFYEIIKEALFSPVSYARVRVQPRDHVELLDFESINELDLASLREEEAVESIEILAEYTERVDPLETMPSATHDRAFMEAQGQEVMPISEVPLFDVRVRYHVSDTEVKIEAVPPEELLVDRRLTSLNLDEADFVAHQAEVSISDLIEMFPDVAVKDLKDLAGVSLLADESMSDEASNRRFFDDEDSFGVDDEGRQPYAMLTEAYIRADFDGDNYAELRRVMLVGNKILENEQVSEHPFAAFSCIPLPHRHVGVSFAQILEDIQLLATVLTRQMLDSVYTVNRDRVYVNTQMIDPDADGMEALENRQAKIINVRGDPRAAVMFDQVSSIAGEILPVLQGVEAKRRMRTGVAPDIHLDPEVLKKTTASAAAGATDQQSARLEALVRVLAETGMKQIVSKAHNALRRHGGSIKGRRIRGEYVQRSPLEWPLRQDMTVNVGVGYNSRQQTLDALMQVLALMEKAAPYGLTDERNAYKAFKRMVEAMGVGHTEEFFLDPENPAWKAPEPAPNPDMLIAQAEMEKTKTQAELQKAKIQADQVKVQGDQQAKLEQAQLEVRKLELETEKLRLEAETRKHEAEIERRKIQLEASKVKVTWAQAKAQIMLDLANSEKIKLDTSDEAREVKRAMDALEEEIELMEVIGEQSDQNES